MLKSFIELTEAEKFECYKFTKDKRKSSKQSFEEFMKYYGGEEFNDGSNCFVALNEDNIVGIIGIVTKEVPVRKEAFIFNFFTKDAASNSAKELLKRAEEVCKEANSPVAKLGIVPSSSEQLNSVILEQGFKSCYDAFFMKYDRNDYLPDLIPAKLEFVRIKDDNKNDYVEIHNNAFRNAPNGGDTSLEELEDTLKALSDKPELIGLARCNKDYVGIYELDIKEDIGWINLVGIHENYFRRGMGEEIVRKCAELLFSKGVKEIRLTVIESNERAVNLYKKIGFVKDEIISLWFEKELSSIEG